MRIQVIVFLFPIRNVFGFLIKIQKITKANDGPTDVYTIAYYPRIDKYTNKIISTQVIREKNKFTSTATIVKQK